MVWGAAGLILGLGRPWEQGGGCPSANHSPPHTPPGWAGLWPPHLSTRPTVVMEKGGQAETPAVASRRLSGSGGLNPFPT